MSDHMSAADSPGNGRNGAAEGQDEDREAAMMRAVMRRQEEHREGGVDPELNDPDADSEPGA